MHPKSFVSNFWGAVQSVPAWNTALTYVSPIIINN